MFKIGDLVRCTGGSKKIKRIGVVMRATSVDTYIVFFFDPPDNNWNNGIWTTYAMELVDESR